MTTLSVSVQGMTCQHCVNTITSALQKLSGVDSASVTVDLNTGRAILKGDGTKPLAELKNLVTTTIEDLGYDAVPSETIMRATLSISSSGMTCSSNAIEIALSQLPDVISVSVSLDNASATTATALLNSSDPTHSEEQMVQSIHDLGYTVESVRVDMFEEEKGDDDIMTVILSVGGMACSHCTRTVTTALQALPGVIPESVAVSLQDHTASFSFQGDTLPIDQITAAIEDAGYDVVTPPRWTRTPVSEDQAQPSSSSISSEDAWMLRKVVMRVIGMTCHSCVAAVTDALEHGVPHVEPRSVHVDLETEMAMLICRNPNPLAIRQLVQDRGYDVENIQIIHNLLQPTVLGKDDDKQSARESVFCLGAVTVETPVVTAPKRVVLQIGGMTCASCVRKIEQGLAKLPGVDPDTVKVNLLTGTASFMVTGDVLNEETVEKTITQMGYSASSVSIIAEQQQPSPSPAPSTPSKHKVDMIITGMFCPKCVTKVTKALSSLPAVQSDTIRISLETGRTSFQYTGDAATTRQKIRQTILQLGFMADSIEIIKLEEKEEKAAAGKSAEPSTTTATRLTVTGMTCSSCVANIERAILKQPGVFSCQVNLLAKSAVVQHDPSVVGARALVNMIEQLGYKAQVTQDMASKTLSEQRQSMRASLQREIHELRSRFLWSLVFAIPIVIIDMIIMMALPGDNPARQGLMTPITAGLSVGDLVSFFLATPVQFWLGLPFYVNSYRSLVYSRMANMETLVAMGTTVAYAASVGSIIAAMVKQNHGDSMDYFETSVLLITFIHCGKWLEALAKGKTAETITKLMDLQPDRAVLVEINTTPINGSDQLTLTASHENKQQSKVAEYEHVREVLLEREIDAKDIQVGDILKVNAGERIPCDGKIWRGSTTTDESMITGESLPVAKKESDDVISATINLSSPIYIRAIRVGSDTTLSRIIQLVQDAQASPKAPIEHLADQISSVFVPVVIFLAISTFIIWEVCSVYNLYPDTWVPMGEDKTTFSLMLAVSVLVIACPCGLGLASPTAVMVGTGVAARHGILVKGGGYALEMANRITTIAFDKTGTLTVGKPMVTDTWTATSTADDSSPDMMLWKILGRVASASNHPLSKSIGTKAKEILESEEKEDVFEGVTLTNAKEVPGRGVVATLTLSSPWSVYGHHPSGQKAINVFLGNQQWMDENRAVYANARQAKQCHDQLAQWESEGKSIVLVAVAPVTNSSNEGDTLHTEGCNDACVCVVCRCSTGSLCCSSSRTMIAAQVAVADMPRAEAKDVVTQLRKQGIEVWMITGDNPRTGSVIAEQLGIDKDCVLAGVKPEQKADKIRNLQRRDVLKKKRFSSKSSTQSVVAMVGDGINDSPSLAQADLGISVGSATDIAIEAAGVVLIRNNLWDLLVMYDISRAVVRRIRINFRWAFIYNAVAIPIAAGVLYPGTGHGLPPYLAGVAMVASSVSVVCSSLLLRLYRAPKQFVRN